MPSSARSGPSFISILALASLIATGEARAQITVENAWSAPTIGRSTTGAIYLTLHNEGESPDRLLSAATVIAGKAELHAHVMDGAIARMVPLQAVEVAPGSPTVLQPGGVHLMLFDVKAPLRVGQHFVVEMRFERAGIVAGEVMVRDPRAAPASEHRH